MNRIEPLDWLRGSMAFSVMLYHYMSWSYGYYGSDTILGRLGMYAVSAFFIISGLSMTLVYHSRVDNADDIFSFMVKRFFRIVPLLWIATTYEIWRNGISIFPLPKILMNYTGTFGYFDPTAYIVNGGWSIGDEMFFYALFPIFIFAYSKSIRIGNFLVYATIMIEILFIKNYLAISNNMGDVWYDYISPYNQLFLFACGIYLYYNFKDFKINTAGFYFISGASIAVFCFYPVYGDLINIVIGENRFIFSLACLALIFAFYKGPIKIKNRVSSSLLNNFGVASYSIYLLHPISYNEIKKLFDVSGIDNFSLLISTSILVTLLLSWLVYKLYELPFIKLGKKMLELRKATDNQVTRAS